MNPGGQEPLAGRADLNLALTTQEKACAAGRSRGSRLIFAGIAATDASDVLLNFS